MAIASKEKDLGDQVSLLGDEAVMISIRQARDALEETRERVRLRREYETSLISQTFVDSNWRHSLDGNLSCYIRIYPLDKYRAREVESEEACRAHLSQAQRHTRHESLLEEVRSLHSQVALLHRDRSKVPIMGLLPEILFKIICSSNLCIIELASLRLVCRAWHNFLQAQSLWREVRSNPLEHRSIYLASKMSNYSLKLLVINLIGVSDDEYLHLFEVLWKSASTLTEVHLIYPFRSQKIFRTSLDFVRRLPRVNGLSFVDLPAGRDVPLEETSAALSLSVTSTSLEKFKYMSNFQPLIFDAAFLHQLRNIKQLSINYGSNAALLRPSNPTLEWILEFLRNSAPNLQTLCLPVMSEEIGMPSEEEKIGKGSDLDFPELRTITLRATASTWARARDVLSRMTFSKLESLDLQSPPEVLKSFRGSTLLVLTLKNLPDADDSGPSDLAAIVSGFPNLNELNLDQELQQGSSLDQLFHHLTPQPSQSLLCSQLKVIRIYNQAAFKGLTIAAFLISRILAQQPRNQEGSERDSKEAQLHGIGVRLSSLSSKQIKIALREMKQLVLKEGHRTASSKDRANDDSWDGIGEESEIIQRFEMIDCDDIGSYLRNWIGELVAHCRFISRK